ncbi:hypothetical protein HDU92_001951 [Lobulomyces angularis]|nr:hypothetical protein HDU92_001951 [Lobulomyces angularis]
MHSCRRIRVCFDLVLKNYDSEGKRLTNDENSIAGVDQVKLQSHAKGLETNHLQFTRKEIREKQLYQVNELKADVLVHGSGVMGAVKRVLVGSTSDYCVQRWKCTVIIPKKAH